MEPLDDNFPIFIPPLRERKQDILLLVHSFIEKYNDLFNMNINIKDNRLSLHSLKMHCLLETAHQT
ncbi:hypothetical protein EKQ44_19175 [Sutcliffiella horikoshii]|nr:hypothetical protein [Sutcliffiella horikoshii]